MGAFSYNTHEACGGKPNEGRVPSCQDSLRELQFASVVYLGYRVSPIVRTLECAAMPQAVVDAFCSFWQLALLPGNCSCFGVRSARNLLHSSELDVARNATPYMYVYHAAFVLLSPKAAAVMNLVRWWRRLRAST